MNAERLQDKCRGCLIGGAVGDALGYPVEFVNSFETIRAKYDDNGIVDYDLSYEWLDSRQTKALISDDTQMTLYTAEALIEANKSGKELLPVVTQAYLAWFGHQVGREVEIDYDSKLSKLEELNVRRAPGNTCLTALNDIHHGHEPHNFSKGCGGIMRVAPVGIFGATHGWDIEETGKFAGDVAEITHKHKMSTIASAAAAMIIQLCILSESEMKQEEFKSIVESVLEKLPALYPDNKGMIDDFERIIRKAIRLEDNMLRDWEIIENGLGGGWVAEETLAIAIFSVLRHIDDFKACLVCSVNHGGDSDSTGAVAGNIIGAILGNSSIGDEYTRRLQFHDLLLTMADKLVCHPAF